MTTSNERLVCTKERPYNKDKADPKDRWQHPDAIEIGDQRDGYPGGDIQSYKCPHCESEFECELPQ